MDGDEPLAPRPPRATHRISFTVTYNLSLPNIGGILRRLHPLLQISDRCKQAVKDVPIMPFRRPKNLQDYLVRAKLPSLGQTSTDDVRTFKCSCTYDVYNYVITSDSFSSHVTNSSYTIN